MKTIGQVSNDILVTTMQIQDQCPELSKYIAEMPITIPDQDNPQITVLTLHAYHESLQCLLAKYSTQER